MLADNAESDLPTLVNLAPGEALDAYLERVADANYLTTARLIEMVRAGKLPQSGFLKQEEIPLEPYLETKTGSLYKTGARSRH